jgi:hypothetical protein
VIEGKEVEQPIARAYHFTDSRNLFDIEMGGNILTFEGGFVGVNKPGLYPKTTHSHEDPLTFCFLNSPYPAEWKKNPELFRELLEIKGGRDLRLFTFDVLPSDNAQVLDFGILEPVRTPKGVFTKEAYEAQQRYINGMTPLTQYKGGFILPEVVFGKHIDYDRLSLVSPEKVTAWIDTVLT